jgi:restriction system protein
MSLAQLLEALARPEGRAFILHEYPLHIAGGIFLLAAVVWLSGRYSRHYWGRHARFQRYAVSALKKLPNMAPAQQVSYLRKINPFVFEELILTAFKRLGHKITRNKKYTGDGGIDGRVCINGVDYLVQAKRYRNHISAAHMSEFIDICRREKMKGLFIHTGRTGKLARTRGQDSSVDIVSGQRLLNLLAHKSFIP